MPRPLKQCCAFTTELSANMHTVRKEMIVLYYSLFHLLGTGSVTFCYFLLKREINIISVDVMDDLRVKLNFNLFEAKQTNQNIEKEEE